MSCILFSKSRPNTGEHAVVFEVVERLSQQPHGLALPGNDLPGVCQFCGCFLELCAFVAEFAAQMPDLFLRAHFASFAAAMSASACFNPIFARSL